MGPVAREQRGVVVEGVFVAVLGEEFAGGRVVEHQEAAFARGEIPEEQGEAADEGRDDIAARPAAARGQDVVVVGHRHAGAGLQLVVGEDLARTHFSGLTAVLFDEDPPLFVVDGTRAELLAGRSVGADAGIAGGGGRVARGVHG